MSTTLGEFYRGLECAAAALRNDQGTLPGNRAASVHRAMASLLRDTEAHAILACRSGCSHCCHFPVGITFDETVHLAKSIGEDPALRARILADAAESAQRSWPELVGRPCPLLVDGACARYEARPMPCRALGSLDEQACARSLEEASPVPRDERAWWRGLGAIEALSRAEPPGSRELRSALSSVLRSGFEQAPRAFADARRAPGSET